MRARTKKASSDFSPAIVTRSVSEEEVAIRCGNAACPGRNRAAIIYFASRDCMDIQGLGEAVVDQLLAAGLVSDAADLFSLKAEQISELERQGKRSAEKLVTAIAESRKQELSTDPLTQPLP